MTHVPSPQKPLEVLTLCFHIPLYKLRYICASCLLIQTLHRLWYSFNIHNLVKHRLLIDNNKKSIEQIMLKFQSWFLSLCLLYIPAMLRIRIYSTSLRYCRTMLICPCYLTSGGCFCMYLLTCRVFLFLWLKVLGLLRCILSYTDHRGVILPKTTSKTASTPSAHSLITGRSWWS